MIDNHAQNQKIGKPNKVKVLGAIQIKGLNRMAKKEHKL
jgi:hypothetical protein